MRDEVADVETARREQPHADPHAAHDRGDIPEVRVHELERVPVPGAERDLARAALVEADDHDLAAHAGDVTYDVERRLHARHLEGGVGASWGQLFDDLRQRLIGAVAGVRGAGELGAYGR